MRSFAYCAQANFTQKYLTMSQSALKMLLIMRLDTDFMLKLRNLFLFGGTPGDICIHLTKKNRFKCQRMV